MHPDAIDKPFLREDIMDALTEAADLVVNSNGYADDIEENERRAEQREELTASLVETVAAFIRKREQNA